MPLRGRNGSAGWYKGCPESGGTGIEAPYFAPALLCKKGAHANRGLSRLKLSFSPACRRGSWCTHAMREDFVKPKVRYKTTSLNCEKKKYKAFNRDEIGKWKKCYIANFFKLGFVILRFDCIQQHLIVISHLKGNFRQSLSILSWLHCILWGPLSSLHVAFTLSKQEQQIKTEMVVRPEVVLCLTWPWHRTHYWNNSCTHIEWVRQQWKL